MARSLSHEYPTRKYETLKDPMVFVIDMNNGFAKEGALADPEIEKIAAPIEELLQKSGGKGIFICDHHTSGAREFDSFPEHCLEGSKEAEILEQLKPYVERIVKKNSINAFFAPDFQPILEEVEGHDLVVTGCCTDLCVLQFALSLQSWLNQNNVDANVILPADCVDTYDIEEIHPVGYHNDYALENMKANGIDVIASFED